MFPVFIAGTCSVPTEAGVPGQNCSQGAWSPAGLEPRTHASDYSITMSFIWSGSPASPSLHQLAGVSPFPRPGSWLVLLCGAVWCWTVPCLWESSASSTCVPAPFALWFPFVLHLPGNTSCLFPCSCLPVRKGSIRHPQFHLSSIHIPKCGHLAWGSLELGVGKVHFFCYFLINVS